MNIQEQFEAEQERSAHFLNKLEALKKGNAQRKARAK